VTAAAPAQAKQLVLLFAIAVALFTPGCLRKDYPEGASVVSKVSLSGAEAVDPSDLLAGLATAESPRFLGIWDGVVFEYEVLDETLLERDLDRIERYYRARGYYEAKVTAARIERTDDHRVRVELRVHEGDPVRIVGSVATPGIERLPFDIAIAANRALSERPGDRFDEAVYTRDKAGLLGALVDRGYAFATVTGHVHVDIAKHEAEVELVVVPGPASVYGEVKITGLKDIPEGPVRDNLALERSKPYSRAELDDAKTALINLGVFSTVEVRPDLTHPETATVPVTVVVQEAPLRTLRLGGGVRFDVLEFSANLTAAWEHENFLGGMRRLTLEERPGLVFYPTRPDNFQPPRNVFPRNRVRAELRQPAFIEGRTTGFVSAEYSIYPLLYPGLGDDVNEHENVIGYQEVKVQVGAERAFFGHHLYVTPAYDWQANFPFAYLGTNLLQPVHVSAPELKTVLDFRDDPLEPHRGVFISNTVQVAGHGFGGDASDVKEQPEVRAYVPISKKVTLAVRTTVGFLFTENYGATIKRSAQDPSSQNTLSLQDPAALRDQQLLLFRAFYSGGPNSNRGYPFRGVGPQGVLGYLLPSSAACQTTQNGKPVFSTDSTCFRPLGGLSLWEASIEVRFPLFGPLRLATFVDASDVVRDVTLRLTYPHVSPGIGLRYATPVGPVRIDVGYRVPYAQEIGHRDLPETEGSQTTVFGLPIAVQF
jgi:outer membrane protein assembly factor BamA